MNMNLFSQNMYDKIRFKNKIKILVTAHSFIEKSGVENYLQYLFNSLSSIAPTIDFVFIVNKYSQTFFKFERENITIRYPSKLLDFQFGKILWYIFFVSGFCKKNQISLIFNASATNTFIPLKKIPVISCVHDLAEFHIKNKYSKPRMFYRKNICLPINKLFTKHFICVSNNTKIDLQTFMNVSESYISVILNGADHNQEFITVNNKVNNKIGYSHRYLLYVGRIDPFGKNLLLLVEAFNRIRNKYDNLYLYLVGNECRGSEIIYKYVKKNRLEEKVKFFGYINDVDLAGMYKDAAIFVFPSLYEGFGFPILEAMKYGVPVVCSNTSSLPEIGGDAALYFNTLNVDQLRKNLEMLLDNKNIYEKFSSKGKIRYKQFTWLDSASNTLTIINNILGINEK